MPILKKFNQKGDQNTPTSSQPLKSGSAPMLDSAGNVQQEQQNAPKQVSSAESGSIEAGSTAAPAASKGPSSSGRFTNIQKYIDANKDFNKDKGGLAGAVVGNISNAAQKVNQNIQGAQNVFNSQANQNQQAWKYDANVVNQALANPVAATASPPNPQLNHPAITTKEEWDQLQARQDRWNSMTPEQRESEWQKQREAMQAARPNQNLADRFAAMRDAAYSGPKSLLDLGGDQNLGALQVGVENVGSLANAAKSEAGRYGLLRSMFGKAGYSQGQNKLDNALLQSDPNQLNKLGQVRRSAVDAGRELRGARENTEVLARNLEAEAAQTKADTRTALQGAVTDFDALLQQRAKDADLKKAEDLKIAQHYASLGALDPALVADLRKQGVNLNELYGVNLSQYLTPDANKATKQSIARADDYARIKALSALAGDSVAEIGDISSIFNNYGDSALVGSFKANPVSGIKVGELTDAIGKKKTRFNELAAQPQTEISQANSALTGDLYVKGGLEKVKTDLAKQLRGQRTQYANNPMMNAYYGGGKSVDEWNKMSDDDVIKNSSDLIKAMKTKDLRGNWSSPDFIRAAESKGRQDYGQWLLDQLDFERNKLKGANDKYGKLRDLFKADQKIVALTPEEKKRLDATPSVNRGPTVSVRNPNTGAERE